MNLRQYLKSENLKIKVFCDQNGLTHQYGYIRHILHGRARPSPDMALRIEKATKGKVDRLELLYPNSKD
jgi:DNA-binding transcriptional regulator YdaS (Cro superfamily)